MRFLQITVRRFGILRELELGRGEDPLGSLVVIQAPNEGGKSTLFSFLTSLLYGFYPGTREDHPFAPWDGSDVDGRATILLEDGEIVEIHRRLLSRPQATLSRSSGILELGNRDLPWIPPAVTRKVYQQVFALTLPELAGLGEEGWVEVQDRLVGALGARDLRSARAVSLELERLAGQIWRPERRGNQRVREIQEALRRARERRRAAYTGDEELRQRDRTFHEVQARLGALREEREILRLRLDRMEELLPVRRDLRRIQELEAEAGAISQLKGLGEDPEVRLHELRSSLAEGSLAVESAASRVAALEERVAAFHPRQEALLLAEERAQSLAARSRSLASRLPEMGQLEQELRDLVRRCQSRSREVFHLPWDTVPGEPLIRLPMGQIRPLLLRLREARDRKRVREEALALAAGLSGAGPPLELWGGGALALMALFLLGGWVLRRDPLLLGAGVLAVALAGGLLLSRRWANGKRSTRPARDPSDPGTPPPAAEEDPEALQAREALAELLSALPLHSALLRDLPLELADHLEFLQERLQESQDRETRLRVLREEGAALAEEVASLARTVGLELPSEPWAASFPLEAALNEARRSREAAAAALDELQRAREEEERAGRRAATAKEALQALEARLREIGEGGVEEGAATARTRIQAGDRARRLREELEHRHGGLSGLMRRIREAEDEGADWSLDEAALARNRLRMGELEQEVEESAAREAALREQMGQLRERETVADVDGEILALEEELSAAVLARDRLFLLGRILREGDRRIREEHQPHLLRRAGEYLATLTGGRYHRILPGEGDVFFVRDPATKREVPVAEPLSQGTREQAYLALRLAVLDQLDQGGEPLPLFVDEALVNWDPHRLSRGLELLSGLSRRRQLFFFTCQPHVADTLARQGGRLFRLDAPP